MNRPGVLFVDDEENALKIFRRAFRDSFEVFTAHSAADALHTLEEDADRIGVVIADQRMPQRSGISMLSEVRKRFPEKVRLLTTAYTEVDTLVDAINEGAVYSFISKPWDLEKLRGEIAQAIESFATTNQQKSLLASRIEELRQAVLDEKALEIGAVAANLSHYVDNALCPVDLLISKIESDLVGPAAPLANGDERSVYLNFLKRIRTHIRSTSSQIARLHKANRTINRAQLARVDLAGICQAAIDANRVLIEGKHLNLNLLPGEGLPEVLGDPARLGDFFNFLLAEEIVSLPETSTLDLRIEPLPAGDHVRITLEDRVPLPDTVSPSHLLHPFNVRSGDPRQLGVFLICAYFVVRSHGGCMQSELREGGGVSFVFDLPVDGPDPPTPQGQSKNPTTDHCETDEDG